jgi:hypothetical protein
MTAAAQDGPPPLTWVNTLEVHTGAGQQFMQMVREYDAPILEQLAADGTIMSWGVGAQMAGPPGLDYAMWVTVPSWASFAKVEQAFDEARSSMSEDDMASMIETWKTAVKEGSDHAQIIRHVVFEADPDAAPPKYLRLSVYTAKPGAGSDMMKMYEAYIQPTYQSLLDDGVIGGYGVAMQAVHTDSSWTHEAWIVCDDFADMDAIDQAFMQADAEASEGEMAAREAAFMAMGDYAAHYDRLLRVVMPGE